MVRWVCRQCGRLKGQPHKMDCSQVYIKNQPTYRLIIEQDGK